ncbi:hypothetical protein Fmac_030932 [Flemingia macrophylla]|uniref:Uncharacterized protein n=1 Tax=Flemingia macrophylla TaxID=520843 RepID=A0ABD1L0N3_9FABA
MDCLDLVINLILFYSLIIDEIVSSAKCKMNELNEPWFPLQDEGNCNRLRIQVVKQMEAERVSTSKHRSTP